VAPTVTTEEQLYSQGEVSAAISQAEQQLADAKLLGANTAEAQALIDSAKQLMQAGSYDVAMAKLGEARAKIKAAEAAVPPKAAAAGGNDWALPAAAVLAVLGLGYWYFYGRGK